MHRRWQALLAFVIGACGGEQFTSSAGDPSDAGAAGMPETPSTTGGTPSTPEPASGAGGQAPTSVPDAPSGDGGEPGDEASAGAPSGGTGSETDEPGRVCPSQTTGDWVLGFFPELAAADTVESHPFFQVSYLGAATWSLDKLEIRYYFTPETQTAETTACYWVTGDRCSLARLRLKDSPSTVPLASRYLEVTFPDAAHVLLASGAIEVRVGFKSASGPMRQTNDYSFDPSPNPPTSATPFPYKPWTKAILYVDGKLAWGSEPCPTG